MSTKDKFFETKNTLNIEGRLLSLEEPRLMGILNLTPDSFYVGSRVSEESQWLHRAEQMLQEGATFLDVGGYSTRPGASDISVAEEKQRVVPAIESLAKEFPEALISVDTFRSEVAEAAVDAGAHLVNDVSGGLLDKHMFATVGRLKVPYVLMHMRGTPQTMQSLNQYDALLPDICRELQSQVEKLKNVGVKDVIVDPGLGFAKSIPQNYDILNNLGYFKRLGFPLLVGVSRKSMIYKTLNIAPEEALNGTSALHMAALLNGAQILRVHDVAAAQQVLTLFKALNR